MKIVSKLDCKSNDNFIVYRKDTYICINNTLYNSYFVSHPFDFDQYNIATEPSI